MIRMIRARLAAASRGQAAVETALVLSIVMLLALATLDLGRGLAAHLALTEATQEGAMVAGYRLYDDSVTFALADVQNLVTTSSSADVVEQATVTAPGADCMDAFITVRSEYAMPVITPLGSFLFGATIPIAVEVDATNFHPGEDC
jgi:Flp pilus assembly protein TadG